ncbi:YdbT family protein [Glaciibacter psychrotolerans]|uniref:DUF3093 domain-containing protein n=1 Tax=Glaciibacter psychrotolerans TaxID=670054 RepID=A0A7Z0EGJ2_9MICO|nr:hypothetical protein [Leifsonia psychrotolerans]NYJ20507.1 hypothetical protein [Leifsonia psychrotolerans]
MPSDELSIQTTLRLRPHWRHFSHWAFALAALLVPIFGVIYWLTIPDGPWVAVTVAMLTIVLGVTLGLTAFRRTEIRIQDDQLSERGFLGRTTQTPLAAIDCIQLIDIYRPNTLDVLPHLFVTGPNGRMILRMRGQFWSRSEMESVIDRIGIPLSPAGEPLTLAEVHHTHPELLYWFERPLRARAAL